MDQMTTPSIETDDPTTRRRKRGKPMPAGTTKTGRAKRSEERQRTAQFRLRLMPQEKEALEAAAARAELDVAAYIRRQTIGQPGPRTRPRRLNFDMAELAKFRGELGYIGNNLNQLTRAVNMGDLDRPEDLDRALRITIDMLDQVRGLMKPPE